MGEERGACEDFDEGDDIGVVGEGEEARWVRWFFARGRGGQRGGRYRGVGRLGGGRRGVGGSKGVAREDLLVSGRVRVFVVLWN